MSSASAASVGAGRSIAGEDMLARGLRKFWRCLQTLQGFAPSFTYHLASHYSRIHNRTHDPYTYKGSDNTDIEYIRSSAEVKALKLKFAARFDKKAPAQPKATLEHGTTVTFNLISGMRAQKILARVSKTHLRIEAATSEATVLATTAAPDTDLYTDPSDELEDFGCKFPEEIPLPSSFDNDDALVAEDTIPVDMADIEVLPGDILPGADDFVANPGPNAAPIQPHAWAPDLIAGEDTHSRRKHLIRKLEQAGCDCGEVVTDADRKNPAVAIQCRKETCESQWYHRHHTDQPTGRSLKNWVCGACAASKRQKYWLPLVLHY
ncbi:hypothetical protein B0H17DRAFT_1143344 [Mycena rosella]|uniref:Zinc finger PHD-type domain-containing protein n=1 Tax=Mycena rosella TaxID=1033263 RepID=A0AAD7CVX5_MYCRO|nr:hypothetical protein B0H17DRAFT_1143344 [Mycena rosella]